MNKWYLYQYIYIYLHEIINKHVLAYAWYYSFCNEILMIHGFFFKGTNIS